MSSTDARRPRSPKGTKRSWARMKVLPLGITPGE